MDATALHQNAVKDANEKTVKKYGVHGPYTPHNAIHDYWLEQYYAYQKVALDSMMNDPPAMFR